MPSRDLVVRVTVVLIAIVAIGLVAATISTPIDPGTEGYGPDEGEGQPIAEEPSEADEPSSPSAEAFFYLVYVLLILVAVMVVWYLINYRREVVKLAAVLLVVSAVLLGFYYLLTLIGFEGVLQEPAPVEEAQQEPGGGDGGTGEEETTSPDVPPLAGVIAILALIFIGALALTSRSSSSSGPIGEPEPESEPEAERAAVAAAAGRAADRIADVDARDVDNEVYRAWREMTDLLEVDRPETTTPGEFEAAAVDAGLHEHHVSRLTRLFEDVRYGHEATTAERESRAVETLRAIEASYATDGDQDCESPDAVGEASQREDGDRR